MRCQDGRAFGTVLHGGKRCLGQIIVESSNHQSNQCRQEVVHAGGQGKLSEARHLHPGKSANVFGGRQAEVALRADLASCRDRMSWPPVAL